MRGFSKKNILANTDRHAHNTKSYFKDISLSDCSSYSCYSWIPQCFAGDIIKCSQAQAIEWSTEELQTQFWQLACFYFLILTVNADRRCWLKIRQMAERLQSRKPLSAWLPRAKLCTPHRRKSALFLICSYTTSWGSRAACPHWPAGYFSHLSAFPPTFRVSSSCSLPSIDIAVSFIRSNRDAWRFQLPCYLSV